jgi:Flp pilus assembly protein TadD
LIRAVPEANADDARDKRNAEIQLLRDAKQFKAAYALLQDATAQNPDDADLVYDQAMIAERLEKFGEMEQLLRRVIALKPDYHHAYNALGYSMADRNVTLVQARELLTKALAFAPNDPYIQDSMAWLEYRSANYAEALRLLQNAYAARPDAEIAAHLGEVLWVSGQQSRAIAIWDEGKKMSPDNESLLQTIQRLRGKP